MSPTRPPLRRAIVAAVAVFATVGCGAVDDAVEDVQTRVETAVETAAFCSDAVVLAQAADDRDVEAAIAAGEALQDSAPDEIAGDVTLVLDAAVAARDGDPSALQSEEVRAAGDRIRTFTEDRCLPG